MHCTANSAVPRTLTRVQVQPECHIGADIVCSRMFWGGGVRRWHIDAAEAGWGGVVGTPACSGAAAATSTPRALCHCKTPLMTGRVGPNKPRCWGCSVVENDAGVLASVCSSGSCCRLS